SPGRAESKEHEPTKETIDQCPIGPAKSQTADHKRKSEHEGGSGNRRIDVINPPARQMAVPNGPQDDEPTTQNCYWVGEIDVDQARADRNMDLEQDKDGCRHRHDPAQRAGVVDG